jgi:hypothetical protein
MEREICLDWGIELKPEIKPKWMRGTDLKPCDCNECFFCKADFTIGIHHGQRETIVVASKDGSRSRR